MIYMDKRTFVVTGATSGLGEAIVSTIIEKTEDIVISVSKKVSESQMGYNKSRFKFIECDLSFDKLESRIQSLTQYITTRDIVFVNNAAIIKPITKVGEMTELQIEALLAVNIKAPLVISNFLFQNFNKGKITVINISTGAAQNPIAGWSLYCSSKAGGKMFFDVLKKEHPDCNIVNFDPGVMDTGMQDYIRSSEFDRVETFLEYKTNGKLKSPGEVAQKVVFEMI
jgi:benzil reductase ((S)-benzoin forming)